MKRWIGAFLTALVPISIGAFTFTGCGDSTTVDDEALASEEDGLWRRRGVPRRPPPPPPPTGGTVDAGGGPAPGSDVGCEVCTEAKACCEAVNGGACNFHADTCAAYTNDDARQAYIGACKTQKAVTQFAWQQAGRTAPASCY
jgi:hypothetical protein